MNEQADDKKSDNQTADMGLIERLKNIDTLVNELNDELTRLETEGAEISHQLVGLVDMAKTEKIKQFINKQPD